jgi:hypothetical protein
MHDVPKTAVIYALLDPRTEAIRYVGKANDVNKRLTSHIRDSKRRNTPVCCWIRKLVANGLKPKTKVLETVDYSQWQVREKHWIAKMRQVHNLLNLASGGDQPVVSKSKQTSAGKEAAKKRNTELWYLKLQVGVLLKNGYVRQSTKNKLKMLACRFPDKFPEYAAL